METLDVISFNLWQMLISLANLVLLFLLLKKFLYKPVMRVFKTRQKELDETYREAREAKKEAEGYRKEWEETLSSADKKADEVLQNAVEQAKKTQDRILTEANKTAENVIRMAQSQAELERKKAENEIRREIVEVSEALAEKMLEREIKTEDHRDLIDSFIQNIGENNE